MVITLYIVMSGVAFSLFYFDKWAAQAGAWRIPELWLHCVEMAFGWPGALIASEVIKHKRKKKSYMTILYIISALHIIIGVLIWGR